MRLIRSLDVTVVAVLHDLNLALAAWDRVFMLSAGQIVAAGPPGQVPTAQLISHAYGIDADVFTHSRSGRIRIGIITGSLREAPQARPGGPRTF